MPIIKRIIPPIIVDILPYFLFNIFPKFNPKNVNNKLVMENIKADITYLSVIAGKPIPVVKLSIITDNPNNKYPGILRRNFSSFSLKLDIIISMAINDKIIPTRTLVFIIILFVTNRPMLNPIRGIIKWYSPTIIDSNIFPLLVMGCVPYIKAKEKASIDRLIAIKIIVIIFKYHHLFKCMLLILKYFIYLFYYPRFIFYIVFCLQIN